MGNQPGKLPKHNQNGRPKKNVHWKSAEPPSPPGRPILIPLSDQQPDVVNLRWERPKLDGGSPITGFIVEHRRMGSQHWVRATPTTIPGCEVSISGLEPGWRYQFRAFAENVVGRSEPSELSDTLTVTLQRNAISVPRFTEELHDTEAVEDERIEFRVRILGQPQPEISWFKDGYEIFSSRRTKIVNDNDISVLIIHQVALTDEGEIKCTATNRAGHVVTKARLLVQAPPRIRLPRTYEDGLIVEAGEILRLKVGVAGQPVPNVAWLHEGEVMQNTGRFEIVSTERNSLLKIDNVQRSDRGEYSIRASNRLGEDVTSFLVTVTARPDPPGKVRLNMSFGKSATLSWTAPIDDGGCKIGNYVVEYFRVGWNVWLKAATTRLLSTTLNDLIEGSEYKFRVKAENPYGLSDPSEESEVLFIPDPKRGITKPKSESKLAEERGKASKASQRKALSPTRPLQDAATETVRMSPMQPRKMIKPEIFDNEDLHREMSYGTPDQVLKMDVRKSPSVGSGDAMERPGKPQLSLNVKTTPSPRASPQHSPATEITRRPSFLEQLLPRKDKSPSPLKSLPTPAPIPAPMPMPPPIPQRSITPEIPKASVNRKHSLTPEKPSTDTPTKSYPLRKTPTPPEPIKNTPALQRSTEPVQLGVNQTVRRYSGHALSPAKNVPGLAIAIAMGSIGMKSNENRSEKQNTNATNTNPTIQISAPPPTKTKTPAPATATIPSVSVGNKSETSTLTTTASRFPSTHADRHDDVHTSNEFMLVVFDKNSKVKDKDKQDSFELDLEEALQPPPVSISSPDLASLEFTNLHTFPLRRSVSSTELLYERAMARFYEAVELEKATKSKKLKISQEKIPAPSNIQAPPVRKRLGSMTEAERLSFERRSELRRQSADVVQERRAPHRWGSSENIADMSPLQRTKVSFADKQLESQESEELSDYPLPEEEEQPIKNESYELGSDYTASTASSEMDSIEKFKMELIARTRSPSPRELETYHPRDMSAGMFTPYRGAPAEEAAVVLTRPMPPVSPDFVPKPILKRSSNENVQTDVAALANTINNSNTKETKETKATKETKEAKETKESKDIAKGIKSFFKRDKRSATEKNTEENQLISLPNEKNPSVKTPATEAAEKEAKRKTKEEEEARRREAERLMHEEAHAAVDHYNDLVREVGATHKYRPPLYLNSDDLRKGGVNVSPQELSDDETADKRDARNADISLAPPVSNKPRLSISERGQMKHVRETASNLSVRELAIAEQTVPDTPSEDSEVLFPTSSSTTTTTAHNIPATTSTMVSETVESPDSRGRTRIVKVKRVIKRRVPSGTRSRDTSTSRPNSSLSNTQDFITDQQALLDHYSSHSPVRRRVLSRTHVPKAESRSPGPLGRKPLPAALQQPGSYTVVVAQNEIIEVKSAEQISEEAHEKVRSALSYSTDLVLFVVACYVYLFKDARLVLPILALMIYRQLGEAISGCIPNWMKRKKN